MKKQIINSQISNVKTLQMCLRKMISLAKNVFVFEGLDNFIDMSYVNSVLLKQGQIAFFYDDVIEKYLMLPFSTIGPLDIYNRPNKIKVFGLNGYDRTLNKDEYVILYDNDGKYPIFLDIVQNAERVARIKRTIDINVGQQRTPRIWTGPQEQILTLKNLLNSVDSMEEKVLAYDNINLDQIQCCLQPAPFVADKLRIELKEEWSEFFQLVGISNVSINKKERMIKDEMISSLGGTIASRYNRYEPRKKFVDEINKKWNLNVSVGFYDGIPSLIENLIEYSDDADDIFESGDADV